jgi:hypothetical protein
VQKAITPLEAMKVKCWLASLQARLGHANPNQLGEDMRKRGLSHNRVWYDYQAGSKYPTTTTLALVEKAVPGSRAVIDVGPAGAPLWMALEGDSAALQGILRELIPEFGFDARMGRGLDAVDRYFYRRYIDEHAQLIPPRRVIEKHGDYLSARTFAAMVAWHRLATAAGNAGTAEILLRNAAGLGEAEEVLQIPFGNLSPIIGDYFRSHYRWSLDWTPTEK